ncbi:aminoacyl-tRNA hydrolase [Haliovirga abyssi]|uniref:Peptidyl-tRNA hydrolase n=1 Tax=Haliovirga abyssi TaxID=2996794 RepID=A0AAU9DHZ1_9FUSO|nr:aminoacyl-tRNA hydrolase [Haliovirga abyssi]BDU51187.1 peptidyl-tRNA hydrolase [Haliovirga abyssi]
MKLIIGLGNPGKEYKDTRHNIGFAAIKKFADDIGVSNFKNKFKGIVGEINYKGEKLILLQPQTFMNLSGNSVVEAVNFYKINPEKDIIVVYDDMDLDIGKLRIRLKGSAGGHNGIKSIISHIGDKFPRIKVGIGKSKSREATVNYVLGRFSKSEREDIDENLTVILKILDEFVTEENLEKIMCKYNKK